MVFYWFIAGGFFVVFYGLCRKALFHRKIQQYYPKHKEHVREISYSLISIFIFIIVPTAVMSNSSLGAHTMNHYFGQHFHSWGYFLIFYPLMLLIHDAYFYWTHRMMHHRWLFRWFHRVHHRSHSPSPWASFSFSPLEAIVQAGIGPLLMLMIPVDMVHINIFFIFSLLCNVYGHLGFELLPNGFNRHWLGRWINTAVHHDLHHQYSKASYSLYFTFWDRIMGTMNKTYDQRFDAVTSAVSQCTPDRAPAPLQKTAAIA